MKNKKITITEMISQGAEHFQTPFNSCEAILKKNINLFGVSFFSSEQMERLFNISFIGNYSYLNGVFYKLTIN